MYPSARTPVYFTQIVTDWTGILTGITVLAVGCTDPGLGVDSTAGPMELCTTTLTVTVFPVSSSFKLVSLPPPGGIAIRRVRWFVCMLLNLRVREFVNISEAWERRCD